MKQFEHAKKDGSIRGDTADLPMKTEGSMSPDTYGADLGPEATNGKGSITGSTKSDPKDKCSADKGLV
ncbi:MAG: hypothetical protein E6Q97_25980 [Desulfurellales bacterium]|nr:MAG: hypothetical protein E6Q97_25980 [Desulfurellales bacterium]